MQRAVRLALAVSALAATAACGTSGASGAASTPPPVVTTRPTSPTSTAPPKPVATLAQDFAAFFQGCEDGDVPPAGIFVTCDPADGSDTAPAAATAACARVASDLGALAPAAAGVALGVENGPFDPTPSDVVLGSVGRALRCTFGAAARVDLAAAPVDIELAGTVAAPAGATACFGHLTPSVRVACRTAGGAAFELVLARPLTATVAAPLLARFATDHV